MKYLLIILSVFTIATNAQGQTCSTLTAEDQSSLDNWINQNSGTCNVLEDLIISNDLDYSGLSFIDTVLGELRISNDVTSVFGLQNIEHVGELEITTFGSIEIGDIGELNIKSVSDGIVFNNATFSDLDFISDIVEIPNSLKFLNVNITNPNDLNLDNLKKVGWLRISNSPEIENLSIFSNMEKIKAITLENTSIESIEPLSTIDSIATIELNNNASLESVNFNGFNNLKFIGFTSGQINSVSNLQSSKLNGIYITGTKLFDVSFLNQVDTIESLLLEFTPINNLSGLSNTVISKKLYLVRNKMSNLIGLEKITSLDEIFLEENRNLISLEGLNNLSEVAPNPSNYIIDNYRLNNCCVLSFLHQNLYYGEAFPIQVEWNDESCSSIASIINGCTDTDQDGIYNVNDNCITQSNPSQADTDGDGIGDECDSCPEAISVQLTTQQEVNDFPITLASGCLINNLYIEGEEDIVDLRPLSALSSLEGTLGIIDNVNLQSLAGLENITKIGGTLTIFSNPALTDIDGLQGLKKVGEIDITETNLLESIDALSSIDSIFGNFTVVANNSLKYCCSMQPFVTGEKYLGGTFSVGPNLEGCNTTMEIDASCTDDDGDGFLNINDNCPDLYNYRQDDFDNDGIGDICDNCPKIYNPNQVNQDNDNYGDACDKCPTLAGSNLDANNNGIGDGCEGEAGAENGYIGLGTDDPNAKVDVEDGDIYVGNTYRGVILKSANGNCFRVKVQNDGAVVSTKIDCPGE